MPASLNPFHLAIPVDNLEKAAHFYGHILGCTQGRASDTWTDWDFFGHQLVTHLGTPLTPIKNDVDGEKVPTLHFGVILAWTDWEKLSTRLTEHTVPFLIKPTIRFQGKAGEQGTFFVRDPAGNGLEFKSFKDMKQIFATD